MEENITSTQEQTVSQAQQQAQQVAKENNPPTIIIQNTHSSNSNGIGTAGFILALIAIFLVWVPFLGWIVWILGLILSGIGVTKTPRGLAIAGLAISLIGLIFLILLATFFVASTAVS
ncbi:hypothetical protein I7X30_10325 [Capnocytophaga sp. 051621]|jgi:hypothetical protein|uniref:DUF4190 domain-containing protein n=1 Tax=Capnocytophaga periodontitidis TaxID=2795027 RepID=A0ABS0SNU2_9FLAO|nr:hypothetical protein [Capnocytophaga periodontitidis]MBI1647456.1 hypothetical protein [Capnocytophaga periodontitidis]